MPRGDFYADNAYNRRIGRAGMPMGSCVISKYDCSSYSGFSSQTPVYEKYVDPISSFSTPPKTYTNNAFNRSLDRDGLEIGMAVHSRGDGTVTEQFYVDNAKNRSLVRVDTPRGSRPESRCDAKVEKPVIKMEHVEFKESKTSRQRPHTSTGSSRHDDKKSFSTAVRGTDRSSTQDIQKYMDFLEEQLEDTKVKLIHLEKENKKVHPSNESLKTELENTKACAIIIEDENKKLKNDNQTLKNENRLLRAKLRKASSPATTEKLSADISYIMEDLSTMKQMLTDLPTRIDRCLKKLQHMKSYVEDRQSRQ